jgi:hypothetical protein
MRHGEEDRFQFFNLPFPVKEIFLRKRWRMVYIASGAELKNDPQFHTFPPELKI